MLNVRITSKLIILKRMVQHNRLVCSFNVSNQAKRKLRFAEVIRLVDRNINRVAIDSTGRINSKLMRYRMTHH